MKYLDISSSLQILQQGGLIAYPTETFYGLGCDATRPEAIGRLFEIKGRSPQNPISILIGQVERLSQYVEEIPPLAQKLIQAYWPGPLTLVFRAKNGIFPEALLAKTGKIGIRISSHPLAFKLCRSLGLPLTTTSANRSGETPISSSQKILESFQTLDGILEGGVLAPSRGSTVLDVTQDPPQLLREGEISNQQLAPLLRKVSS